MWQTYGEVEINASDQKILNMTEDEYQHFQNSEAMIIQKLEITVQCCQLYNSKAARNIVLLHQEWSSITWKQSILQKPIVLLLLQYTQLMDGFDYTMIKI